MNALKAEVKEMQGKLDRNGEELKSAYKNLDALRSEKEVLLDKINRLQVIRKRETATCHSLCI